MKRLHTDKSHNGPLRKLKLLLIGLIAATGMLVAAQGASAAATAAPEITLKPSDPNTTQGQVRFDYNVGAGETSTADPYRFYCRQYPTATPPAPTAGWVSCGSSPPDFKTYDPLNGSQTFEVAGRESTSIATQGPIASYVWNQNVPLPTVAPEITTKPSDPNTTQAKIVFEYEVNDGETSTADPLRFYCRNYATATPPAASSGWSACGVPGGSGTSDPRYDVELSVNGSRTFEVATRTNGNFATQGPIASYVWNQNVAPISMAPEITAKPSNPNTTQATAVFTYTKGVGETSAVDTARFYCRQYDTASPPPAASFWGACGLSTDPPASKSYTDLSNVSRTFQVAARTTTDISTQGPIASWVWDQNVPIPTKAPIFTDTPDDPNTDTPASNLVFTAGEGENGLVNRFQCRLDSSEEDDWTNCGTGSYDSSSEFGFNAGNGDHILDVRAGNFIGFGEPIATHEWTVDIPDPSPAVNIDDIAITRWDGTLEEAKTGATETGSYSATGATSAGDINDDGLDDLVVGSGSLGSNESTGTDSGISIVYSTSNGKGVRSLANIDPSEGYKIDIPVVSQGYKNIGDQNGDGIPDLMVVLTGSLSPPIYIVYGVADPSSLPLCDGSDVTRCLKVDDLTDSQGYKFVSTVHAGGQGSIGNAGDFDGDGIDDLFLGAPGSLGAAYIVRGGVRTGTIDVGSLPADQKLEVIGETGAVTGFFGPGGRGVGDMNQDGFDDVFIANTQTNGSYILYGHPFTSGDNPFQIVDFSEEDGLQLATPFQQPLIVNSIGDVNGDGRIDLAAAGQTTTIADSILPGIDILYGPEQPTSDPLVTGFDFLPGTGYQIGIGLKTGGEHSPGEVVENIGDFNNDGVPDLVASDFDTTHDGITGFGAGDLLFGQNPAPTDPIGVGPDLTPSLGLAFMATHGNNAETGERGDGTVGSPTPLGDFDGDGLADFAVSAPYADPNGVTDAGSVYIIPGSKLINQVKTGNANGVTNTEASISAGVSSNNRDTEVHFEYGTTDEYGSETAVEEFEGSGSADSASADLTGLEKGTEYHYRAVATNALGLVRYGDDKTFTTTNTIPPDGPSPCVADKTLPGCSEFDPCAADNTVPGCSGYDHCKAVPADCNKESNAKLALITSPKSIKVKRGKKGKVSAIVVNSGGKTAKGVKVCVKAPKKFIKVKKCLKVGKLASGATKTKTFKVKVTKKAKKGKKITLKFTASSKNAGKKTAKAKVVVQK
jgi:hypothetical protein